MELKAKKRFNGCRNCHSPVKLGFDHGFAVADLVAVCHYALIKSRSWKRTLIWKPKFGQELVDYKKKVNSIIPFSLRRIEREQL